MKDHYITVCDRIKKKKGGRYGRILNHHCIAERRLRDRPCIRGRRSTGADRKAAAVKQMLHPLHHHHRAVHHRMPCGSHAVRKSIEAEVLLRRASAVFLSADITQA